MKWEAGRWERPCEYCLGDSCEECGNSGWVKEEGHPKSILTHSGRDLFQAYRMLKEYGAFPVSGGWMEQSEKFLRAVDICDQVNGLYRDRAAGKEESERRLKEEARKVMDRVSGSG